MRILITGVTGFLGRNLVQYLSSYEEFSILGFSRDSKKIDSVFQDQAIRILKNLDQGSLDKYHIDVIIHLAGIAHDLSGAYTAADYENVNFKWTTEIFEEFSKSEATTFMFASSVKSVVDHSDEKITELTPPNPTSAYGISKQKAEEALLENCPEDKSVFIFRPCMIHGPGNKGNLNLLYRMIKYGMPYPLGAFENQRSFLSVENFCFAISEALKNHLRPGIYNLADDDTISTVEIVRIIGEGLGKKVRILNIPTGLINIIAKIGTILNAPFNEDRMQKLTENMILSNEKLLLTLKKELPVKVKDGLLSTIRSFNE